MIGRRVLFDDVVNAALSRRVDWRHAKRGLDRLRELEKRMRKVEEASGLPYPPVRVTPEVKVLIHECGVAGVVHGNPSFVKVGDRIVPIVEVTLPLLLYADGEILTGVLAHEFLHYIYLAERCVKMDYFALGQPFGGTVLGRITFDEAQVAPPEKVYRNRYIVGLLRKRFDRLLSRRSFVRKVEEWIEKGYPHVKISSEKLQVKMGVEDIGRIWFPREVVEAVKRL